MVPFINNADVDMPPKKKLSREETLLRKRQREKERYEKIKNDPVKYALQREKERKKYENKKKKKQVKLVCQMSERELRMKRKQWRKNSLRYLRNKKQRQQVVLPESPADSDNTIEPNVTSKQKNSGRKQIRRDRSKIIQRNKKLISENAKLKTKLEKYKKRYYRLIKPSAIEKKEDTPRTKVRIIMEKNDKETVRRRLLFGEALEQQLKSSYKAMNEKKKKKEFLVKILGDKCVLKKYKVLKDIRNVFTKRLVTRPSVRSIASKRQRQLMAMKIKDDVEKFFLDDENSRLAPGKKDCKTMKKIKKQKRYLNDTMLSLHKAFLKTVDYKISYAQFCRLRPFWVVYQKPSERDTCQCTVHTNTSFIVSALHQSRIISSNNPKKLAELMCCSATYKVSCLLRQCKDCVGKQVIFNEFDGDMEIHYYQWIKRKEVFTDKYGRKRKVTHTIKVKKTTTALGLVNELENIMFKFMKHEAIILNQYSQLKRLKIKMQENDILVHMDFSENYSCKYASEIQSFHFGGSRQQVSLHTTSVLFKETSDGPLKTKSFCTFSSNLSHTPVEIVAHLQPVFEHINKIKPNLRTIHFLSDSPSNQYRNKLMFYLFSHVIKESFPNLLHSTWNYYEAGHGKGTPDGIGGTIKRTADRLVNQGNDIDNIDVLVSSLKTTIRSIEMSVITEEDIGAIKSKLEMEKVIPFKGSMKVHQVVQAGVERKIEMKSMSCFDCLLNIGKCTHWTLGFLTYPSNEQNGVQSEEIIIEYLAENGEIQSVQKTQEEFIDIEFKDNDFVLVIYEEELFPGQILETKNENGQQMYKVRCMQKSGPHWKWPTIPDEMFYDRKELCKKIDGEKIVPVTNRGVFKVEEPLLEARWFRSDIV